MSSAVQQVAFRYLFSHYGDFILADNPIFDDKEQVYISNLRSDYPLIFQDDRTLENRFHLLKVNHLGSIFIDKDCKVLKDRTTSREECIENLKLFFKLWLKRAEEIIVSSTAESLVYVSKFNHYFDTIDSILGSIYDNSYISDEDINDCRHSKRLNKTHLYLELLQGLEIIRRNRTGYSPGNTFVSLKEKSSEMGKEHFVDLLLAYIIKERYPTLRDVFKLTILEPTIHVDSCIYLPEIEEGTSIFRTEESIQKDFKEYYSKPIGILDLRLHLRRLENCEAIRRDGKHYFGNEDLLAKMIERKKELHPFNMCLLNQP